MRGYFPNTAMHKKRVVHVYPAMMTHHLSTMIPNNRESFADYDNDVLLVSHMPPHGATSSPPASISPSAVFSFLVTGRFEYVIFHSGFWPKFWLVALMAVALRCRPIWICWGGELSPPTGMRGRLISLAKELAIPRFHRTVFLSAGDLETATRLCRRPIRGTVIPYYSPAYFRARHLKSPTPNSSMVRVQIGNDASATNGHLECIARLSSVPGLECTVVLPLSYGRFDSGYIQEVKDASDRTFSSRSEFLDDLLPPEMFDTLIDSCSALLLASREQRALYSIFRYLAAGKPVFLPGEARLRQDLVGLGFRIEVLEALDTMSAEDFALLCRRVDDENIRVARECLGRDSIRVRWTEILG